MILAESKQKVGYFLALAFFLIVAGCGSAGNSLTSGNPTPTQTNNSGSCVVGAQGVTSATLSWAQPTTNTDGSALTDLTGYKIYYGTSSGVYPSTNTINITGANMTTYTVNNLTSGQTYYFVMTAYDTAGNESAYSSAVCKMIN